MIQFDNFYMGIKKWGSKLFSFAFVFLLLVSFANAHACVHQQTTANTTHHFYDDSEPVYGRLLQQRQREIGKIRIFIDYTHVTAGTKAQVNLIQRLMNISASYFYNVLTVVRENRIFFPGNIFDPFSDRYCNELVVPRKYITQGTIADLGIFIGNEYNESAPYVAKSTACSFLASNRRPFWGMVIWNNFYLRYDQVGFQEQVFVSLHQMIHVLGFSASLFKYYASGNPLVGNNFTKKYSIRSQPMRRRILEHFECNNQFKGLPLQNQDIRSISSHWEKKVLGNDLMTAASTKNPYMSVFTLALLESTGWYTSVDYDYAEPTTWGKGKGCRFLDTSDCRFEEFCNNNNYKCDWDGTAVARCLADPFIGKCKITRHFLNTICMDENFDRKNVNRNISASEEGGSTSRCYRSNFRRTGSPLTTLNFRCYVTICSQSYDFIYLLVGSNLMACRYPNQAFSALPGFQGYLACPSNFDNYCRSKKTCAYHCNKNGLCTNGKCLCTGETELSNACMDISVINVPTRSSGGFLNSRPSGVGTLSLDSPPPQTTTNDFSQKPKTIVQYSMNSKCFQGTFLDEMFGLCLQCKDKFGCQECKAEGCIVCDDERQPVNGKC